MNLSDFFTYLIVIIAVFYFFRLIKKGDSGCDSCNK